MLDHAMRRFGGIAASDGIAIGPAHILAAHVVPADRHIAGDAVDDEIRRLTSAVDATDLQLQAISVDLDARHQDDGHLIVEAHRMILKSDEIVKAACAVVRTDALAAESAVRCVIDRLAGTFAAMDDQYLRERSFDIESVGQRLLQTLVGRSYDTADVPELRGDVTGRIAVGSSASVIELFDLHRCGLTGFATERGGKMSHAAITMRALETPYVVGIPGLVDSVRAGETIIVDGSKGEVVVRPDPDTLRSYRERRQRRISQASTLLPAARRAAATIDGTQVEIAANIELLAEVPRALELGAESVGLLRTELLYLHRPDLPGEDEQHRDAAGVVRALGGRTATFRTLDLGGDKLPLAVKLPEGANPSLGVRAIRFSARRPDIFRTQLRALYRASASGPLRIMFPLISGVGELIDAKRICDDVRRQLTAENIPHDARVPIGAMIETPSAAMTADHIGEHCDFLSIGTNDLIQYAFAADRDNRDVDYLYQPFHPAVLRLLKYAVEGAARVRRPIALCGEMAGDPLFTWVLLGLGIRQFSMSPARIPAVKSIIASTVLAEAEQLVHDLLTSTSARDIEERVTSEMRNRFPVQLSIAA